MKNLPSSSFCVLPWMHLATNSGGNLRLCCNSTPGKNLVLDNTGQPLNLSQITSVNDFWNTDWLKTIRRDMLQGNRPSVCERCFREEDAGVRSARQGWNEKYFENVTNQVAATSPEGHVEPQIEYVDLRLGNLCNLRCVMCNPYASNQWVKDWNQINPDEVLPAAELARLSRLKWFENDQVWSVLEEILPTIREIYLTGGEPTLAKKQYELLQKCIDRGFAKRITLKYNTNLVHLPDKLLGYWKNFETIRLNVSLDGYGELNEFIRYPSCWDDIHQNLLRLDELARECPHLKVSVHTTVQAHNMAKLIELFEYLKSFENIQKFPYLNILNHPKHLNIRILPFETKQKLVAQYGEWMTQNAEFYRSHNQEVAFDKLNSVLNYMIKEDWSEHYGRFEQFTRNLESIRHHELPHDVQL